MDPELGFSNADISFNKVVFPAPDGPVTKTSSPFDISKSIFCKISGLVTEADLLDWKAVDFTPYLEVVFEVFGEDRVLYGSDWPVCLLAAPYEKVYRLMADYTTAFSPEASRKFFGGNAARIYNIKT